MSLLESGWPRRLLCLDPVLPLSLHCPGTTHMGLCTQPEGETDTAKRNLVLPQPPEFLCESVSVYSKLKKSFVAEKGGITLREPHVRVGLAVLSVRTARLCAPLCRHSVLVCFNCYVEHLVIKMKS